MRIDAHQHYWKLSRGDYGWLTPDMGVLYRDFLPADLKPTLEQHRIDKRSSCRPPQPWRRLTSCCRLPLKTTQSAA